MPGGWYVCGRVVVLVARWITSRRFRTIPGGWYVCVWSCAWYGSAHSGTVVRVCGPPRTRGDPASAFDAMRTPRLYSLVHCSLLSREHTTESSVFVVVASTQREGQIDRCHRGGALVCVSTGFRLRDHDDDRLRRYDPDDRRRQVVRARAATHDLSSPPGASSSVSAVTR